MTETMEINKLAEYLNNVDEDWNYILPKTLFDDLKKGTDYFLLDVRRESDYRQNHIKNAVNIFWLDLLKPENLKRLPKDRRIVVICYVGHTASQVMVLLSLLGYDVRVLKFGMGHSPIKGIPISGWLNMSFDTE